MTNSAIINPLRDKYGDSFYVFDKEKLRANYLSMFSAFSSRYSNFIIGYSYKTNYVPSLIMEMSQLGAYAEVVSRLEYDLALRIGVKPNKIIFNGPFKRYDDIELALKGGSILNLDSFYEIESLKKYIERNPEGHFKVGLRASFDLTVDGNNPLQSGFQLSRFGFCVENGNLESAIDELKRIPNLKIVGLHGHFSTSTRSINVYRKITQTLCDLSKKYLANTLEYIDIGGGMYGNIPKSMRKKDVPSFDDYAEAVCEIMNKEKDYFKQEPLLIVEPGLSMVVDTFQFYCKVMDIKVNQDEYFVLVKGSVHNIKPTMHPMNMPMEHIRMHDTLYKKGQYNVVGYTCMEKDYLSIDFEGSIPKQGDFLIFKNVGAYTIVFDPPFIKERPPIISMDGNNFSLVRKREMINDFINENVYVF